MTTLFNNLKTIINKYSYTCDKKINILTDDHLNNIIQELVKEYQNKIHLSTLIDDFGDACIIILWFDKYIKKYDTKLMKFINEYIEKDKIFIFIVPKNFDFNYIVKHTTANSINAISWLKEESDIRDDKYLIVIKK